MKLILTRHGETIENQKKIMQGHLGGHLSENGKWQVRKLALRLKNEKIDAMYSSDLKRAADTAKEIAKYHKNIQINFVQELREVNLGSLTGKCSENVDWNNRPDDIESATSMQKRAKKLLDKVYNKINKAMIGVVLNKKTEDIEEIENQHNTSVNIFEIKENKKHVIHLMNCVKHLK